MYINLVGTAVINDNNIKTMHKLTLSSIKKKFMLY